VLPDAPERGEGTTTLVGVRRNRLNRARLVLVTGALAGSALLASEASSGAATTTTSTTAATTSTTGASGATTPSTVVAPSTPTNAWLRKAIATEAKVGSVHINGHIVQGKSGIVLSLLVNGDGEGGGTFAQDGSTIQLKRVGTLLYFNAPKKYWASHATTSQTKAYGGKWIVVDALDTRFQSFDQFLNAGDLAAAVFEGYTKPLTVSKPTTLDGHKVVVVSDTATAKGKRSSVQMYIAATGQPYVLKIVDKGPTQSTTLAFSSYGKPVAITTPPEPINLTGSG
jgi:hypothetical protein